MLARLIRFSLTHSALVLLLAAGLLVYAGVRLGSMPVDVFPELNAPTVVVLTEAGGLAADEVEQHVTFPVESGMGGMPGVRRVRSASAIGLSIVWVEFDWGSDIYRARQLVTERLAAVRELLPEEAHSEVTPITSITGEIMLLSLSSPDGSVSPLDLRSYAEFDLRTRLMGVQGVAAVVAIGGQLPEYQINVRQDRLALYGLTVADVAEAARRAHSTAPAGYLASVDHQEVPIRQAARVRGVADIEATPVRYHQGAAVTIGQVAEVALGPSPSRGTAADAGVPAVVLSVQKAPGTNTLSLTRAVDRVLDQAQGSLPAGAVLNRAAFRQANFIQRSVSNVMHVLRDATIIVTIILILFLLNVRTTIITLTALPLSLAAALLLLDVLGLTINVMTLGGLAVAIGVLVDDAIIDVENVFRRLKEESGRAPADRRGVAEVVFEASNEIRPSMVFATVIIVIVFVPLLFLEGLEGRFFRPLGMTYIVSILASLGVALTVTPALCRYLLGGRLRPESRATGTGQPSSPVAALSDGGRDGWGGVPDASDSAGRHSPLPSPLPVAQSSDGARGPEGHGASGAKGHSDGFLVRWLKRLYEPSLRLALRHRGIVLGVAAVVTVLSLWLASTFGTSFLPRFNEGTFTVFLMAPPGTSLAESNRLAGGIERRLAEIEGVASVVRRTGRAERDEHAEPVSSSEIEVTVREGGDAGAVRRAIDDIIADVPGVTTMVGQPIEHRLSHILSGTPASIAINVYGEDLDRLRGIAKEVEAALRSIPGTRDVAANREVTVTSLPIRYRHQDLAAAGLTPADAAGQVRAALYGETVAVVNQGVRRYEMVVRLHPEERERIGQVEGLMLVGMGGARVRLREVADIGPERTSNLIARENNQRKAVISTNVAEGFNLGDLVREVRAAVDPIVARAGYTVAYGGQFEAQRSASRTILIGGGGVVLAMLVLLHLSTGSLKTAAVVMVNLPLSLIGGIAAIYLTQGVGEPGAPGVVGNTLALLGLSGARYAAPVVSIASLVGFITLFGIAVRNGILLVNHYAHLVEREGWRPAEAVVQGSMERLVPILMTALCAALGLVPLALAMGEPGSELLAPLAVVVLGGLLSSTFLNLIVVPAAYSVALRVPAPPGRSPSVRKNLATKPKNSI